MEFQLIVRILGKISFRTAHNKLPGRSTIRRGLSIEEESGLVVSGNCDRKEIPF